MYKGLVTIWRRFRNSLSGLKGGTLRRYAETAGYLLFLAEQAVSRTTTGRAAVVFALAKRYAKCNHLVMSLSCYDAALASQPSSHKLAGERLAHKRRVLPRTVARDRSDFASLRTFCGFIGYPRSGHSLLGAIIDAHPNACISHEADVLRYVSERKSLSSADVLELISENSEVFYRLGRRWQGHDYDIPRIPIAAKELQVIGDKKGDSTLPIIARHPELFDDLSKLLGLEIKIIHCYRNPFDNIARMALRDDVALDTALERYFALASLVRNVSSSQRVSLYHISNEELIAQRAVALEGIFHFLDLDCPATLRSAFNSMLYDTPNRSRFDIEWSDDQVQEVKRRKSGFDWLHGYDFHT